VDALGVVSIFMEYTCNLVCEDLEGFYSFKYMDSADVRLYEFGKVVSRAVI
jgi:hypothetical protein